MNDMAPVKVGLAGFRFFPRKLLFRFSTTPKTANCDPIPGIYHTVIGGH